MNLRLTSTVAFPPEVLFREVEGEAVLLDLRSGSYFGLDGVGRRIWQLLQAHRNLQTVHQALVQEYDAAPEQLENDLLALVERLRDAGLVTVEA